MNKIAPDASCVVRGIPENFKGISVKPVKSIFGAKPEKSFFILQATDGGVVGKSVLYLVMPEVIGLAIQTIR